MEYCEQNNIKLLKEDIKHIRKCISNMPYNLRKAVLRRYCDIWVRELKTNENVSVAQNLGRKAANLYLLKGDDD